jgi:hypothetical protein
MQRITVRRVQVRDLAGDVLIEELGEVPRGLLQRGDRRLSLMSLIARVFVQDHRQDREHLVVSVAELA